MKEREKEWKKDDKRAEKLRIEKITIADINKNKANALEKLKEDPAKLFSDLGINLGKKPSLAQTLKDAGINIPEKIPAKMLANPNLSKQPSVPAIHLWPKTDTPHFLKDYGPKTDASDFLDKIQGKKGVTIYTPDKKEPQRIKDLESSFPESSFNPLKPLSSPPPVGSQAIESESIRRKARI
jgi:hypothetical protein